MNTWTTLALSTQLNACMSRDEPGAVKRKAWPIADVGQSEEHGMSGRGISATLSQNWIVLLHLIVISVPQGYIVKSPLVNCFLELNR